MAIETEKKYRLGTKRLEEITQRLIELGAEFEKEVFEVNYQHRGGEMDERGATLRLRKIGDFTMLTYKEKVKNENGAKQKIEFETQRFGCRGGGEHNRAAWLSSDRGV